MNNSNKKFFSENQLKSVTFKDSASNYGDLYALIAGGSVEKVSSGNYSISNDNGVNIYVVEDDAKIYSINVNTKEKSLILTTAQFAKEWSTITVIRTPSAN